MSDIPSAIDKMNTDEVAQDKPLTEALFTKIGANINGLIDDVVVDDLNNRVDVLEGRVDNAIGYTVYTSPKLLPEDLGVGGQTAFLEEFNRGITDLLVDPSDKYYIGQFNEASGGGFHPTDPQEVFELRNPYDSSNTSDAIMYDSANIVTLYYHKGGPGNRMRISFRVITLIDV